MEPATVERLTLINLRTLDDLSLFRQKYNITFRDFVFFPEEANFISRYVDEYGRIPDITLLQVEFPDEVAAYNAWAHK